MLYTVVPLEEIYKEVPGDESQEENCRFELPSGFVDCVKSGDEYHIMRLHSTNMSDYLNPEYTPGSSYRYDTKKKN